MRNNSKLNDASKPKDDQHTIDVLSTSIKETRRVAELNQQRLRQLELAVANLTTICCAIRHEMYSLGSSPTKQGSCQKADQAEVIEMKRSSSTRSSSPSLDLKDDVLRVQMHQLAKQGAALGVLKDSKTNSVKLSGKTKADSKPPIRPIIRKNVQPTTNQKTTTKQMIQGMDPTIDKKMTRKPETVSKYMGTSQPKAKSSPQNGTFSARVSLKSSSTIKRTQTTVSRVYDNRSIVANKSKETSVKNVETSHNKSYLRRTIQGHQGVKCTTKCHAPTRTNPPPCAADVELKQPRKKWSTANDITFMK